jgi:hypothetical protein
VSQRPAPNSNLQLDFNVSARECVDATSYDAIAAAAAAPPPRDGPPPPALALPAAYVVGQADRVARADDLAALRDPSAAVLRHVQRLRRRHELQQAFRFERPKAPAARAWAANVTSR